MMMDEFLYSAGSLELNEMFSYEARKELDSRAYADTYMVTCTYLSRLEKQQKVNQELV